MQKRFHDLAKQISGHEFKVGDKVFLDGSHLKVYDITKGKSLARKALDKRRLGPYTIGEVLGDGTAYKLDLPRYQKFHPVQPISRLIEIRDSAEFPEAHVETPYLPVIIDDMEEYEIEKIVRHKSQRGTRKYWIKYLGYDETHNQWKFRDELSHAGRLLQEYDLQNGLLPTRRSERRAANRSAFIGLLLGV